MTEDNLVECTYGHHMTSIDNFTASGLNGKYFTICRSCKNKKQKAYIQKHYDEYNEKRKKYNESRREYNRKWIANKREQEKLKAIELCN